MIRALAVTFAFALACVAVAVPAAAEDVTTVGFLSVRMKGVLTATYQGVATESTWFQGWQKNPRSRQKIGVSVQNARGGRTNVSYQGCALVGWDGIAPDGSRVESVTVDCASVLER